VLRLQVEPESGAQTCIVCDQCAKACPDDLIALGGHREPGQKIKILDYFDFNLSRCSFCGLCSEVCLRSLSLRPRPPCTVGFQHHVRICLHTIYLRLSTPYSVRARNFHSSFRLGFADRHIGSAGMGSVQTQFSCAIMNETHSFLTLALERREPLGFAVSSNDSYTAGVGTGARQFIT
jgi:ferredoxin